MTNAQLTSRVATLERVFGEALGRLEAAARVAILELVPVDHPAVRAFDAALVAPTLSPAEPSSPLASGDPPSPPPGDSGSTSAPGETPDAAQEA